MNYTLSNGLTYPDMLNRLHDLYDYTDKEIADILEVSREHVSRLRHGKYIPSPDLAEAIVWLFRKEWEEGTPVSNERYDENRQQRLEEEAPKYYTLTISREVALTLLLAFLIVGGIIWATIAQNNQNKRDRDSSQTVQTDVYSTQFPYQTFNTSHF